MMNPMRMRWTKNVARIGVKRNTCRTVVAEPEGKRPLGRATLKSQKNRME
jgi:hypothetical protein